MEIRNHSPHSGSLFEYGLIGEGRNLLAAISSHLLALLKLARFEAEEAQNKLIKKLVFVGLALVFFFVFYLALNAAGAFLLHCLMGEWIWALLTLAGINLVLGVLFVLVGSRFTLSPLFPETLTELETDLVWIKEKHNGKSN